MDGEREREYGGEKDQLPNGSLSPPHSQLGCLQLINVARIRSRWEGKRA